jgi:hypothetical protein
MLHKAEAEKAVRTVAEALAGPEPIEGLRRFQLRATLEYALEQLAAVQELKRPRKTLGRDDPGAVGGV